MNSRTARARLAAGAVAALTAGALAVSASPASAKFSDGYFRGYDKFSDDWDDEGELGYYDVGGRVSDDSNAVCLWQKILWAEGARKIHRAPEMPKFKQSDVDGLFDWDSYYATQDLQKRWGLGVDGAAGKKTLGKADSNLTKTGGSTARGKKLELTYHGKEHKFSVVRNAEGKYSFRDGDDKWRIAGYDYRTCN
jgi:hypothetical protein